MAKETAAPQTVAEKIAAGYVTKGAALGLGAVILDGTAYPEARITLPLEMMNRHGLVAGATGTGKTRTLQLMAEQLSAQGVPVFLADIKGDLSGVSQPGRGSDKLTARQFFRGGHVQDSTAVNVRVAGIAPDARSAHNSKNARRVPRVAQRGCVAPAASAARSCADCQGMLLSDGGGSGL